MDLGETRKRKIISANNIAMIFLIIGFVLVIIHILLILMNPSANVDTRLRYGVLNAAGLGFLLAGILITLLSMVKILERAG